jgi:hypothetical protein
LCPLTVQPHETNYAAMATAMGVDPASGQYIPFNMVNKTYAEEYHRHMLAPIEDAGLDFWWLDWQQGEVRRACFCGVVVLSALLCVAVTTSCELSHVNLASPAVVRVVTGLSQHWFSTNKEYALPNAVHPTWLLNYVFSTQPNKWRNDVRPMILHR